MSALPIDQAPEVQEFESADLSSEVLLEIIAVLSARLQESEEEVRDRQTYFRVAAIGYGAWQLADGALFVASGPVRLQSQVFAWAQTHVPVWPWPVAVFISVAGCFLLFGAFKARLWAAGRALQVIALWHFCYFWMIWHAIDTVPGPGLKPVSFPPLADHAALSAVAWIWGLMLLKIWRRKGKPRTVDHAHDLVE